MHTTVRIPSRIYSELFDKGGDKLISVFCMLKSQKGYGRKYYSYTAKNNKFVSHYSLLRNKTTLSLSVLKKYVPMLVDMGFVVFEDNGNVSVIGNNKLKKLDTRNNTKLVPVKVFDKYKKTELYSYYVRIHSNIKTQEKIICKKLRRRELIQENPFPTSKNGVYEKLVNIFGKEIDITENVMLSNISFSVLKDGSAESTTKGNYLKNKLYSEKLVYKKRQFKELEQMSYERFKKKNISKRGITYCNGCMVKELPNIVSTEPIKKSSIIKNNSKAVKNCQQPLNHLQFDFLAWLVNEY